MVNVSAPLIIGLLLLFIALPIIIYTYLVFPNFDAFMQRVSWYSYTKSSQNELYWLGFWVIVLLGLNVARVSHKS